jgi:hypothetical protein
MALFAYVRRVAALSRCGELPRVRAQKERMYVNDPLAASPPAGPPGPSSWLSDYANQRPACAGHDVLHGAGR